MKKLTIADVKIGDRVVLHSRANIEIQEGLEVGAIYTIAQKSGSAAQTVIFKEYPKAWVSLARLSLVPQVLIDNIRDEKTLRTAVNILDI